MFRQVLFYVLVGLFVIIIGTLVLLKQVGLMSIELYIQTAAPIISGAATALLSFLSACLLFNLQENEKIKKAQLDAFIRITNEISANLLTLTIELTRDKPFITLPLQTDSWDRDKNLVIIKTPLLRGGIHLLYDDINVYNWQVAFKKSRIMDKSLTKDMITVNDGWQDIKKPMKALHKNLAVFERLACRELVLLGVMPQKDFEKNFGQLEDKISLPYFNQPDNENSIKK